MVNAPSTIPLIKPTFFIISTTKQVVPEHESHKEGHDQEGGSIDEVPRSFGQRAADHRLYAVEEEVGSVEWGNRQQIENPDTDRGRRAQLPQPWEAECSGPARHVGDLHRPAELAFVL